MPKISRDLDFLIRCFQEVLEELGEHGIAARLPWCGHPEAGGDGGSLSERLPQALSTAFALLNMVEENTFAQNHRALSAAGRLAERSGSWEHTLALLHRSGRDAADIASRIAHVHVEPVLTAHPTQARRRTILEHHRRLYRLLVERENQMWTPGEQRDIRERIKAELEMLWRSGEIHLEKPDVASEVRNVLHYLRNVFPSVLPLLIRRLRDAWGDAGLDPALIDDRAPLLPRLTFGSWVGGDRDGHPFVTAEVTRDTLAQLRTLALGLLRERLQELAAALSLSHSLQAPGDDLVRRSAAMLATLGARGRAAVARNPGEPWRQSVNLMLALLPDAHPDGEHAGYAGVEALLDDLQMLRADLIARGGRRLARIEVAETIELARLVGFHGARLDIRQNSRFHDAALAQLLTAAGIGGGDFAHWDEARRLELIERELAIPRPFVRPGARLDAEARAVLDCY
jgi:phosphoenolpyruvate carboxylase